MILAGGAGSRLGSLTRKIAKPALPFAGQYRNIDFTLSNCVNSGVRDIAVVTQYRAACLADHMTADWGPSPSARGFRIEHWPAENTARQHYRGTADAIHQNAHLLETRGARHVLVLAADHVYKMDYRPMIEAHAASGAAVTVACVRVPLAQASSYGVVALDADDWIEEFREKPRRPQPLAGHPEQALVSMGIYVFDGRELIARLAADEQRPDSSGDFGHDVLPRLVAERSALAYEFSHGPFDAAPYWRDVGTIGAYWQANMDIIDGTAGFEVFDRHWPIWTRPSDWRPVRIGPNASIARSVASPGCLIDGMVDRSVFFTGAEVGRGSSVHESLLLPDSRVGRNCVIRRAIIDSGCTILDGTVIDARQAGSIRGYERYSNGLVLVTADMLPNHRESPPAASAPAPRPIAVSLPRSSATH